MKSSFAVLALGLTLLSATAAADSQQVAFVKIHATARIAAPPSVVWAHVTQGRNLVTWCPEWKAAGNARVTIAHIGDVLDYTDAFGNGGRSVVTFLVPNRELRVAHEPVKGDYVCQAKFVLTPVAGGTKVDFWDCYSDASVPADLKATEGKMDAEAAATLAALKQQVEQK